LNFDKLGQIKMSSIWNTSKIFGFDSFCYECIGWLCLYFILFKCMYEISIFTV